MMEYGGILYAGRTISSLASEPPSFLFLKGVSEFNKNWVGADRS
jgi:hypothetical protein